MSPQQVTCAIQQGFKPLSVQKWAYLKCGQDGLLDRASSQEFNGADVVSRKGSLYLCQDEDTKVGFTVLCQPSLVVAVVQRNTDVECAFILIVNMW